MDDGRPCEICGTQSRSLTELDERIVVLCPEHAEMARTLGAKGVDQLRASFLEASGRRSLLPRRGPEERRMFPPRPEGRRRDGGRRASDG